MADIAGLRANPDGFHLLASTPTSGALDYVRSPLLRNRLWWAMKLATGRGVPAGPQAGPGRPGVRPGPAPTTWSRGWGGSARLLPDLVREPLRRLHFRFFPWHSSNGDNALDALEPHCATSVRLYVFGQQYTTGLGVHDVHQNQGDPLGSQWYPDNGIWQDGGVIAEQPDGRVVVWQVKFNTQALNTDDQGHPRLSDRRPSIMKLTS